MTALLDVDPQFKIASSGRTSSQFCYVSHVQASGHFPQSLSTGGEETAEQSTRAEFLQPDPPTLGMTPQPIEDTGDSAEIAAFPLRKSRPV